MNPTLLGFELTDSRRSRILNSIQAMPDFRPFTMHLCWCCRRRWEPTSWLRHAPSGSQRPELSLL